MLYMYMLYVMKKLEVERKEEEGKKEEEEGERELGSGETDKRAGVLLGVVLCLHKKIPAQGTACLDNVLRLLKVCVCVCVCTAHMHNLAGSLGADCHWTFDHSCTHYIYQVHVYIHWYTRV